MKNVSVTFGHGCSIAFDIDGRYFIIEFERLLKERYFILTQDDEIEPLLLKALHIAKKFYNIENDFEILFFSNVRESILPIHEPKVHIVKKLINHKKIMMVDHHKSHAACAAYQSPYSTATIISFDGAGNDGVFNIYKFKDKKITLLKKLNIVSMGKTYRHIGLVLNDIKRKPNNRGMVLNLPVAGKLMGLVAYGKIRQEWISAFESWHYHWNRKELENVLNISLFDEAAYKHADHINYHKANLVKIQDQTAYDLAATNQHVWEEKFFKLTDPYLRNAENIILTGGCALNVLLNEKVRKKYGDRVFVCPNTDDTGLALGHLLLCNPPKTKIDVTYCGLPILDIELLDKVKQDYRCQLADVDVVVDLLKKGKIIGVLRGQSEVGQRALGNRSIICDPRYPDMKDKLNTIKNREWYRPFAPMVRYEDRNKYFEFTHESPFMSFSPLVREEYRDIFPSITHVDGTARVQTVKADQNKFIYELLSKIDGLILNTSFNINGNPMLTTVEDALDVLNNTSLDCLIIEDTLVLK